MPCIRNPQRAELLPRHVLFEACPVRAVLMAGSCATGLVNPSGPEGSSGKQISSCAAGSLVGAGCIGNVWRGLSTAGARPFSKGGLLRPSFCVVEDKLALQANSTPGGMGMSYVALRRWRPQSFDDIVGQPTSFER